MGSGTAGRGAAAVRVRRDLRVQNRNLTCHLPSPTPRPYAGCGPGVRYGRPGRRHPARHRTRGDAATSSSGALSYGRPVTDAGARGWPRGPAFLVLALLAGVGPLATDMYLPSLPALAQELGTTPAAAQLTLTAFIVGLAVGQVVLGPFSDATGRRPFVLVGPACFVLTSLASAAATSVVVLVGLRLLQGAAAAAGVVASRAVVSDHYRGDSAARRFGLLSSIVLLSPVIAPVVGSLVLLVADWRAMFLLLAGFGLVQLGGALGWVPETLPREERHPGSVAATAARMADLLRDWTFSGHVAVQSLATMGFFAYIGGSTFVLQEVYGIAASTYGIVFAVNATCMAATSALFARLVGRRDVVHLRRVGLALATSASVALAIAALVAPRHTPPLPLVLALLPLVTAGMGLVVPASITLAQQAGQRARGTAAALNGGISFVCGAAVIPLTGLVTAGALVPMATIMAVFLTLAVAVATRTRTPE